MVLDFSTNDRQTNSNFTRGHSRSYCQLPVELVVHRMSIFRDIYHYVMEYKSIFGE